jgi:hypothetical protein
MSANNPQFDELSKLAAKYRCDMVNFDTLKAVLESHGKDGVDSTVDFGAQLARCKLLDRHWLERCISTPVFRETKDFVWRMCIALRQAEQPSHASQKEARHGIHEFRLIPDVSGIVSRAVTEAVLMAGGDNRGTIAERVVRELDAVWNDICVPLISGERKALEHDVPALRKLGSFILRLVQMHQNGRSREVLHATAASEFSSVAHVLHRVSRDDWFTTSRVPLTDLINACSNEHTTDAIEKLTAWLPEHGHRLHEALVADCARIDVLRTTNDFAAEWHGLGIDSSADDPSTAALVTAPSYLGTFSSDTGRIYARSITTNGPQRVVGVVRCMFTLRHLVANGLFPLGKFDAQYAKALVEIERQRISFKTSDIISKLLMLCQDFEFRTDAMTIDRFIDDLVRIRTESSSTDRPDAQVRNPGTSASAVCALPDTSSSFANVDTCLSATRHSANGLDFFVLPGAKVKTILFSPSAVARASLMEYVVIYSTAAAVNDILSTQRTMLHIAAIGISNTALVDHVSSTLQSLYSAKGSPLGRVIDQGNVNRASLTQMVSHTIRKLLKAGADAANIAQKHGATGAIAWTCSYKPTRTTNELVLHIGNGVRDPACYLFLDACMRVKNYLDESWPLPDGMAWPRIAPRRGKPRRSAKGVPEDESVPSDGETTADTHVVP